MQRFLPHLMAILRRGKDNAAIFQVLEGYLVTADPPLVDALLNTHMQQIAEPLLACLNAVLQVAQKAQAGSELPCTALPCPCWLWPICPL